MINKKSDYQVFKLLFQFKCFLNITLTLPYCLQSIGSVKNILPIKTKSPKDFGAFVNLKQYYFKIDLADDTVQLHVEIAGAPVAVADVILAAAAVSLAAVSQLPEAA
jgi:hypothetical protein